MEMVSVIVRTLGTDMVFLDRAILSIVNNSYNEKEIILVFQGVDDAIFDTIKTRLETYRNLVPISYVHNKTEKDERSKNLNLGIQTAIGKYVAFLDDDDYVAINHYQNLIDALEDNDAVLSFNLAKVVSDQGVESHRPFKNVYVDKLSMLKDNFITINSFVLNREKIAERYLAFNEDLKLAEDYLFLLPIYLNYKTIFVKEKTSFYYIKEHISKSFLDYEKSSQRSDQYKLLKHLKKTYTISWTEKIALIYLRIMGRVYKD